MTIGPIANLDALKSLPEDERKRAVQNTYPDHPLFAEIRDAFIQSYPQCRSATVFCGMAPGVGPLNAIMVKTRARQRITGLPRAFLGLPVLRQAEGRSGFWLPTGT